MKGCNSGLCTERKKLSWLFGTVHKLYLFVELKPAGLSGMESFHWQVFIRKAAVIRAHFRLKVMHLSAQCKNRNRVTYPSITKTPPRRVPHSKLISILLSWMYRRLSTQTTCHEQTQSEKQSGYGFLFPPLWVNCQAGRSVCTPCGLKNDSRYTTSLQYFSTETGATSLRLASC